MTALHDEVREWDKIGFELKVPGLEELETGTELAHRQLELHSLPRRRFWRAMVQ